MAFELQLRFNMLKHTVKGTHTVLSPLCAVILIIVIVGRAEIILSYTKRNFNSKVQVFI
jgi:hypothetical protein